MSSTDIKAQWLTCWLMQTNANLYLYIRRTFTLSCQLRKVGQENKRKALQYTVCFSTCISKHLSQYSMQVKRLSDFQCMNRKRKKSNLKKNIQSLKCIECYPLLSCKHKSSTEYKFSSHLILLNTESRSFFMSISILVWLLKC